MNLTRYNNPAYASFLPRLVAAIIDGQLFKMMTLLSLFPIVQATNVKALTTTVVTMIPLVWLPLAIMAILYPIIGLSKFGQTVGKAILGITVKTETGLLSAKMAIFREFIAKRVSGMLWLGYLAIPFNPDHQGWHDQLAATKVLKTSDRWWLGVVIMVSLYVVITLIVVNLGITIMGNRALIQDIQSILSDLMPKLENVV